MANTDMFLTCGTYFDSGIDMYFVYRKPEPSVGTVSRVGTARLEVSDSEFEAAAIDRLQKYAPYKRILDLVLAPLCFVVLSPVYLTAAIAIFLEDGGPVHFVQERVGQNGTAFKCFKLRTMRIDAERGTGPQWARVNDPRVTKVGKVLRKTRMDELPQFFNVILGNMSLVGPRPMRMFFVEKISAVDPSYKLRLIAKPGMTGMSQLYTPAADTVEDHLEKCAEDMKYMLQANTFLDLKLIFKTVLDVISARGR